jgi:hypothetical protein
MTPEVFDTTYADASGTFETNGARAITAAIMQQFSTDILETFTPIQGSIIDTAYQFNEDFIFGHYPSGNNFGFLETVSDGTADSSVSDFGMDTTENCQGVIYISTGTTATGYTSLLSNLSSAAYGIKLGTGSKIVGTFRNAIGVLGSGTERYQAHFGFGDTAAAEAQNGCYFRYADNINSGKWECVTANGGSRTATDSGVTANTLFSVFTIEVLSDGLTVKFYINGTLVATNTTNIPNGAAIGLPVKFMTIKTVGTTARLLYSDYYSVAITRATSR